MSFSVEAFEFVAGRSLSTSLYLKWGILYGRSLTMQMVTPDTALAAWRAGRSTRDEEIALRPHHVRH